ncbi:hypothetical protein [Paenibacillus sp. N3/727]|nr:hypothetical protein [Paenibacillus sp. N3/727]
MQRRVKSGINNRNQGRGGVHEEKMGGDGLTGVVQMSLLTPF